MIMYCFDSKKSGVRPSKAPSKLGVRSWWKSDTGKD